MVGLYWLLPTPGAKCSVTGWTKPAKHTHRCWHSHSQTRHGCRMAIVAAFQPQCPGCCDALSKRRVIWLETVAGYLSQEVTARWNVFIYGLLTDCSLLALKFNAINHNFILQVQRQRVRLELLYLRATTYIN